MANISLLNRTERHLKTPKTPKTSNMIYVDFGILTECPWLKDVSTTGWFCVLEILERNFRRDFSRQLNRHPSSQHWLIRCKWSLVVVCRVPTHIRTFRGTSSLCWRLRVAIRRDRTKFGVHWRGRVTLKRQLNQLHATQKLLIGISAFRAKGSWESKRKDALKSLAEDVENLGVKSPSTNS